MKQIFIICLFLASTTLVAQSFYTKDVCYNLPELEVLDGLFIESVDSILFKISKCVSVKNEKGKNYFLMNIYKMSDDYFRIGITHSFYRVLPDSIDKGFFRLRDYPFIVTGEVEPFFSKKETRHEACFKILYSKSEFGNESVVYFPHDPCYWALSYEKEKVKIAWAQFVAIDTMSMKNQTYPVFEKLTVPKY